MNDPGEYANMDKRPNDYFISTKLLKPIPVDA